MKRIKRTANFQIDLNVSNPEFAQTPRPEQQSWFINRALKECAEDLDYLDQRAGQMITGAAPAPLEGRADIAMDDQDIMEDWQRPIMSEMARVATARGGDILEIGFGRGIASDMIQATIPATHTIIDCNPTVVHACHAWAGQYPGCKFHIIEGRWEDTLSDLGTYDGILFHTYPLSNDEYVDHVMHGVTFAANFFPVAAKLLKPGGQFTYFTNEADSLSRAHQRLLHKYFHQISLRIVHDLPVPENTRDSHWFREMVIISASAGEGLHP